MKLKLVLKLNYHWSVNVLSVRSMYCFQSCMSVSRCHDVSVVRTKTEKLLSEIIDLSWYEYFELVNPGNDKVLSTFDRYLDLESIFRGGYFDPSAVV